MGKIEHLSNDKSIVLIYTVLSYSSVNKNKKTKLPRRQMKLGNSILGDVIQTVNIGSYLIVGNRSESFHMIV